MRQKILEAALAITDERGLDAVSMRSVAQRVGVSAMALYPHVSSKEALLDGIVDMLRTELLTLLEPLPSGTAWWTRLVTLARGVRELAARHPSAFSLLLARPSISPDALRATDVIYQAILDAGVPDVQVARIERLISTFVLGFAASEVNGRFVTGTRGLAQWVQPAPSQIPAHHRLTEHLDRPIDWDAEFEADLQDLRGLIEALPRGRSSPGVVRAD